VGEDSAVQYGRTYCTAWERPTAQADGVRQFPHLDF